MADNHAATLQPAPAAVMDEPTYDVRFRAEELWPGSSDEAFIHVGVFRSYLENPGSP